MGGWKCSSFRPRNKWCVVGLVPGSEWILHGCDFGCDSDVNFICEDLPSNSARM